MSKILFIEARKKFSKKEAVDISEIKAKLPEKIHLLYIIQYKELAEIIKSKLEDNGKKIVGFEQVLGCSKIKPKASLLLIGSGKFHALNLALSSSNEIYVFDSYTGKINKITEEEILKYRKKQKAKLSKFFISKNIGLLVSSKPGQSKLNQIENIKKKLKEKYPEKNFYLLVSDTINTNEFENYNIDIFISTACPGLELDSSKIINLETL